MSNDPTPTATTLIEQLSDREVRNEYVADQVRTRFALAVRALREQPGREWSQSKLGREMGKPQSVISRLEDCDYGRLSLETMLEVAAVFDLPLRVDFPEWPEWFRDMADFSSPSFHRQGFDKTAPVQAAPSSVIPGPSANDCDRLQAERDTALAERDKARAAWRSLLERHAKVCAEYGVARDELTMLRAEGQQIDPAIGSGE